MTLEGAINFHETDSYVIYTMNSATTGQYCVVLPKNANGIMNMLVDLHMKSFFDGVSSATKTKEQLVEEIGKEYLNVKSKYSNAMLVFPMIDEGMFQSAVGNNDKQKMFDEVKKIGAITSEIYKKLTNSGVAKQNIDQKIIIIEKNEVDDHFVLWLKEQMPNFVDGVHYSDLVPQEVVTNPFVESSSSSIFGTPVVDATPVSEPSPVLNSGSIFDTPVSSASVTSVVPEVTAVPTPEPVIADANVANSGVDIFGIPNSVNGVAPMPAEPVIAAPVPEAVSTDVANNVVSPATPVSPVVSTPSVMEPQGSVVAPVVEAPQPVNSVNLEGTTTFSAISNATSNSNPSVVSNDEVVEENRSGSKGFVNLVILLVILVGVTIASIELGKFLYNVYGA